MMARCEIGDGMAVGKRLVAKLYSRLAVLVLLDFGWGRRKTMRNRMRMEERRYIVQLAANIG